MTAVQIAGGGGCLSARPPALTGSFAGGSSPACCPLARAASGSFSRGGSPATSGRPALAGSPTLPGSALALFVADAVHALPGAELPFGLRRRPPSPRGVAGPPAGNARGLGSGGCGFGRLRHPVPRLSPAAGEARHVVRGTPPDPTTRARAVPPPFGRGPRPSVRRGPGLASRSFRGGRLAEIAQGCLAVATAADAGGRCEVARPVLDGRACHSRVFLPCARQQGHIDCGPGRPPLARAAERADRAGLSAPGPVGSLGVPSPVSQPDPKRRHSRPGRTPPATHAPDKRRGLGRPHIPQEVRA